MSDEKHFILTGFESAPKRGIMRKIKDLGGCVLSPKDLKPNEDFILICAQPKWTEKFITACSAGMWILQPEFVEQSFTSGCWLREGRFEWNLRKRELLGSGFGDGRLLEAPQRWRMQVASGGRKAFHEWNVLVMVKNKMNKEAYTRMLTFGGAVVTRKRECLNEVVWKSLTHVFVDEGFCLHHADIVKSLINEGYQCLSPNYIRDYVAQPEPPSVKDYNVGSPELFQAAPRTTLLVPLVIKIPSKDSVENFNPRKTPDKTGSLLQTRHGVQDEWELEALRKSILELMPSSFASRQQKEQLMNQKAIVVVESLQENLPYRKSKDELRIKRLEEKSSLVKYPARNCDRQTRKDDLCVDLPHNVVFEDISPKKTCNASSEISCSKDTLGLRAINSKKRKIPDDVKLGSNQKKTIRLLSNLSNKLEPHKSRKRNLSCDPVLNETTMKTKCVIAAQRMGETRLSKKPVEPLSAQSPLSNRQPLFPRQVVNETTSCVRALQANPSVQSEIATNANESSRNQKENVDLLESSLLPVLSVIDSPGSVNVVQLSKDVSVQGFSKNPLLFSSTAAKVLPLKHNCTQLNELHEVVDPQRNCEARLTESHSFSSSDGSGVLCAKQSSVKNCVKLFNSNHIQPTELNHLMAWNSNSIDLKSSSIIPSEFSNSNCYERTILNQPVIRNNLECLTSNQPVMFSKAECMTFSSSRYEISVQDHDKSDQLLKTDSKSIESGESFVVRAEANDRTLSRKLFPDSLEKHPLSNAIMMFTDACLNTEEETHFHGRDFVKKFVDAVSFFVAPKSYPPSGTLTLLLKMLVEERGLGERLTQQISTLLDQILWLHEPISALMKQVYVEAFSRVSAPQQNWQLVDYLFRKVIEFSYEGRATNVDLLFLRFIVRFLELDFLESKRRLLSTGCGKGRSVRWCLITQWLWTNEFAAVRSAQFGQLVAVLITAVRLRKHSAQMAVVGLAQKLVAMGAEAWLLSSGVAMETSSIPRDPWMLALVIAEQLADERTRSDDLKLFLETSECDWLAMVICRMLVDRMNPDGIVENCPLSLGKIVTYFNLRPYEELGEEVNSKAKCDCRTPSKVSLGSPRPLVKRRQKLKDVNKTNAKGETKLHIGCRKNNLELVRELLQTPGIDVNRADNAGWTALHEACNRGNKEAVQELLQFKPKRTINSYFTVAGPSQTIQGVDVRAASNEGGITPLHDAVLNGHSDVCRLLLQHAGPQLLEIVDKKGKRPTDYARTDEMMRLLSEVDSLCEKIAERKPSTSEAFSNASLSSTQSAAVQNNASTTETTLPPEGQSSSTLCSGISSDCSQRYCLLVSNLVTLYISWRRNRLSVDDREVLTQLPVHVLRLRRNLLELQNGELLSWQMAALARIEALADLQMIAVD